MQVGALQALGSPRPTVVGVILLSLVVALAAPSDREAEDVDPIPLSLVALIANPARHHQVKVRAVGVAGLAFEGTALYLHKEDYDHRISTNAVWLQLAISEANRLRPEMEGRYVVVDGVVDAHAHGLRGLFPATLRVSEVRRFREPSR